MFVNNVNEFSLRNDNTYGGCPVGEFSFKKICFDSADKENCVLCSSSNTKECEKCVENKVLNLIQYMVIIAEKVFV